MMILRSVTIGEATPTKAARADRTGIDKTPVDGPVHVGALGLSGDTICDLQNHGGVDQAVYVYGSLDYDWWSGELDRPLAPGTFGENMIFEAISCREVFIGDRFAIGKVLLEVTAPRIPCATFAERMADKQFPRRFQKAGLPGFYCRVISEGDVRAGDFIDYQRYDGVPVRVADLASGPRREDLDAVAIQKLLSTPLHYRIKDYLVGRSASP